MLKPYAFMKSLVAMVTVLLLVAATTAYAQPFAYVPNDSPGTLSVIDTATNTVVATVAVGVSPFGIAVNPGGARAYVTNAGSNDVSVIDTVNFTVVATVSVGNSPQGIAVNPAGTRAYVGNRLSNTVSVIDTATNTVAATVTVGSQPQGVAVNPGGTRAYVTNRLSNSVSVIDTATDTVVALIAVGAGPHGVAVNPAGTFVYVANESANNVSVIDTAANMVVATVPVGSNPYGITVNAAGTRAYVANFTTQDISVIDTATNNVVATVPVGGNPWGISVNSAGTRIYVVKNDGLVAVIDSATNNVVATVPIPAGSIGLGAFIGGPATTVPGAPTIGTATAGVGSATVSFTPPAFDGGNAVASYQVLSSPGGIPATGTVSPITVIGLSNGTPYTFTVTATNAVGTGPASAASNSVTPAVAGPFVATVTNTNDSGAGSLRQALMDVQANCAAPTKLIQFAISGTTVIPVPSSPLPPISCNNTTIDGYSQALTATNTATSGSNAVIKIVIDGNNTAVGNGISISGAAANVVVTGLSIVGFASNPSVAGIYVGAVIGPGPILSGNFIGVLPDGTGKANSNGIVFQAAFTSVGGPGLADRNVIACNTGAGISATGANNFVITQNVIGLKPNSATCGNGKGIYIQDAVGGFIGQVSAGNIIQGNLAQGIVINETGGGAIAPPPENTDPARASDLPKSAPDEKPPEAKQMNGSVSKAPVQRSVSTFFKGGPVEPRASVFVSAANSIRISNNSIFGNGGLGIDLQNGFISVRDVNDVGDLDSGANNHQNYPDFLAVKYQPNQPQKTLLSGQLLSDISKVYDIEIYASSLPDFPDLEQGETLIFATSVMTDGTGVAAFVNVPISASFQKNLSMLATSQSDNNTSEFSLPYITPFSFSPATGLAAFSTTAGTPQTQTLTFTNLTNGSASPQIITGATVALSTVGNFTITGETCSAPMVVTTCTVNVQYNRATVGTDAVGLVTLTLNVPKVANPFTGAPTTYEFALAGTAAAAAAPAVTVSGSTTFPNTTVGASSGVQAITITNSGSANLIISGITHSNASVFPDTTSGPAPNAAHYCGFGSLAGGVPNTGTPISILPGNSCVLNLIFAPNASGPLSGTITVNSNAATSPTSIALTGTGITPAPVITSPTTAGGVTGSAFTYTITATNTPTSFGATGLPTGVTVSTATGLISGTPTITGTFSATIAANNAGGTGSQVLTITITAATVAPTITSAAPLGGTVGTAYSHTFTATGTTPITWSIATGAVPPGLTLNATSGTLSGTPTSGGSFPFTIQAANGTAPNATQNVTIVITVPAPVITSPATASGVTGSAFTYNITASNAPTSFGATGLPAGVTVNTATGLISGTPSITGTFSATITANNVGGTGMQGLTITITAATVAPTITSTAPPNGTVGTAYSRTFTATGTTPITWSIVSGTPPTGLTLNASSGILSGTPTVAGSFGFTIQAANGTAPNATQNVTIIIGAAALAPTITFNVAPASFVVNGTAVGTLTITNPNATTLSANAFTFNYLPGLVNAPAPNASSTCPGAAPTATPGAGNSAQPTSFTLPASGSCTFSITFTSAIAAVYSGTIAAGLIVTPAGSSNATPFNVTVTAALSPAVTLTPSSVNFGARTVNTTSPPTTVTLTNSGAANLVISSITGSGDFGFTTTCPISTPPVAAGANCTINITFTPLTVAILTGTISIASNAPGSPHTITLSGSGTATAVPGISLTPTALTFVAQTINTTSAVQNVIITNTGFANLTFSSVTVSGPFSRAVLSATSSDCASSLAPSSSCQIGFSFTPTGTGVLSGQLTINDNASGSPHTVTLSGTGTPVPVAVISVSSSIAFGDQIINTASGARLLTISNTGTAPLTISAITLTGTSAASFTLTGQSGCASIAVAGSCTLGIGFTPTTTGAKTAQINLASNAQNAATVNTITLTGNGILAPRALVSLTTTAVGFGNVIFGGATPNQIVTLTNGGGQALSIAGIAVTGDFIQTNNCGTSLAPLAQCTINILFTPLGQGPRFGEFILTTDAITSPDRIQLSGTGCRWFSQTQSRFFLTSC